MTTHEEHEENVGKLRGMIKGIEFAMLTTAEDDGSLRSRPMATQKVEFDGDLYFFTKAGAPKVDEVERDRHVCVSYAAPEDQCYVSMSGTALLTRDRQKMEELWSPVLKAWFPGGLDDPELALLKVSVTHAEFWEGPSSTVVYLVGLAKAFVAGETYRPGENEKLDLKGQK